MKKSTIVFLQILLIVILQQVIYSQEYGRELDSLALVALYDSTDGLNWNNKSNWVSAEPIDDWHGVTVSEDRITELVLEQNNLNGPIPDEICNLTNLENLNFYVNILTGSIPENIGNLSALSRLYLNHNQLEGPIPDGVWQLTNLQDLFLNSNNLTGTLSNDVGNLIKLENLVLFANSLSDSIPESIGNLTHLREFNIYRNEFRGSLPSSITNLDSLRKLILWTNLLEGPLPADIDKLTYLESLSISSNRFSGEIPASIGNLKNLNFLALNGNSFDGPIPESIGNLSELTFISMGGNELSGPIPDTLGNLSNVTTIYLNYNKLSGPIPVSLGRMIKLTALLLNGNQLDGTVPTEITNLTEVNTLFLKDNQLDGLPDLSSMTKLSDLAIDNNYLTFEDIEPNMGFSSVSFAYAPQADVGTEIDTLIDIGGNYSMSVFVGGENNSYQWFNNDVEIPGAQTDSYQITSATPNDSGIYICRVANSMVPDLTIKSKPVHIQIIDPTGISDKTPSLPKQFVLQQNYPNPFNPKTKIYYELPSTNYVDLSIFNILGHKIATIVSKKQAAGIYNVEWDATGMASGVYYYRIEASEFLDVKKMILLR